MSLLNPIPLLYRWLAIGALVLAFGAACWVKGNAHGSQKLFDAQAKAATEGVHIAQARAVVTEKIVTKYLPQIVHQQVVTETILKEVPVYVPSNSPDLPGGFRVLYDAAATGRVPDTAGIADAAPVPAQDLASTDTENLGICRADQLRLTALQEWVREQGKVK